ncbi:DNA repair protein RecO [uncultured Prevotella sp.]|uniref:DNA repair protein RecO n=1 Tax=uncultured Prevotella sp. TaxID=159272 RepID=UPI0025882D62|nr:DNA repair protein RecO [uncultured Prevotella sp.]
MKTKTEAIVLHSVKYGEQKLIVDMFTRQWGRLSFALQLPRTAQAKLKKQYFQPLTLLNIEADIRQQVQLQKISEASLLSPLPSLLSDPSKLAIGLFVCEFLYHALRDEQHNEPLFDYVRTSIEWLDGRERDFANFHLVFLMRLSRFLGFYPNLELRNHGTTELRNCENSLYFDLRAACFCEQPPLHRDFLMPQEASRIHLLMRMDYATMHLFRLGRADRNRILEILIQYYRLHIPQFPELRSLLVLQELFQ